MCANTAAGDSIATPASRGPPAACTASGCTATADNEAADGATVGARRSPQARRLRRGGAVRGTGEAAADAAWMHAPGRPHRPAMRHCTVDADRPVPVAAAAAVAATSVHRRAGRPPPKRAALRWAAATGRAAAQLVAVLGEAATCAITRVGCAAPRAHPPAAAGWGARARAGERAVGRLSGGGGGGRRVRAHPSRRRKIGDFACGGCGWADANARMVPAWTHTIERGRSKRPMPACRACIAPATAVIQG
eukprot:360653-Chlamydomonas_euryale.AAC.4